MHNYDVLLIHSKTAHLILVFHAERQKHHQHRHRSSIGNHSVSYFLKALPLTISIDAKKKSKRKKRAPRKRIEIRIFLNLLSNEWKRTFLMMIKKKDSFLYSLWLRPWSWTKRYEYITSNNSNKINSSTTMNVQCFRLMPHASCPMPNWITLFVRSY